MKTNSFFESFISDTITRVARRNYNTYVKHYESRNLKPMSLEEFLKNYNN